MTTEDQLKIDVETAIESEWNKFVATTDFITSLDFPAIHTAKAAFRNGYFAGMNFSTLTLAENLRKVLEKVEQSGK
jgi:hypothetical protein